MTWDKWLKKSEESMMTARENLANSRIAPAISRAYFAAFQAVTGALIKAGYQPQKGRGNWGHRGTQGQLLNLISRVVSKQHLFAAYRAFKPLYRARGIADYGDDAALTASDSQKAVREAGQIVVIVRRLIERGEI
jgi:uncharacterized protein (UPF0332 family)